MTSTTEHLGLHERLSRALHVSNGDATDLAGTGLGERILHWRDVLHEGPVPDLGVEELRRVRADFLRTSGADDRDEGPRCSPSGTGC